VRASRIWKALSSETRHEAAQAFWQDDESPDIQLQQMEALAAIARRLNFRLKSVQSFSSERRAAALAKMTEVSDGIATRALVAFHFAHRRELMAAFLDALGVEHEDGLIASEAGIPAPEPDALGRAVEALRAAFADEDVTVYLRTLVALDEDTWKHLGGMVEEPA
jgi:hypothetical protein